MSKMLARSCYITALFLILPLNCHEGNMTNMFDIRDEQNTVEKYVAAVLFSLLLLYGIVGNILLAIVFCSRENLYNRAFILITSQLIICNFMTYTQQVTIVLLQLLKNETSD
ncbi:hypothetical protein LOAG_19216, partial [Loa loa]